MNTNSFLIKGWCVLLVSALFALAASDKNQNYIIIAFFPTVLFWLLDTYYLQQERLFRSFYDHLLTDNAVKEYKIDIQSVVNIPNNKYIRVLFSKTIALFYPPLLFLYFIVFIFFA